MEYPSKLVEEAVNEIARLPGIGRKTALRLVLHLLKQPEDQSAELSASILRLRQGIRYCGTCHIISDTEECTCKTIRRDDSVICVVEDTPDAMAIRNTGQYQGMFHVLGGRISPMDGIGPDELRIESLIRRVSEANGEIREIILALSATMEGDTTGFYIMRRLGEFDLRITTIARGIPVGGELEYADELTLGRSISTRVPYNPTA